MYSMSPRALLLRAHLAGVYGITRRTDLISAVKMLMKFRVKFYRFNSIAVFLYSADDIFLLLRTCPYPAQPSLPYAPS